MARTRNPKKTETKTAKTAKGTRVTRKSTRAMDRISLEPKSPSPAERSSSPEEMELDEPLDKMDQVLTQIPAKTFEDDTQAQIQAYLEIQAEAKVKLDAFEASKQAHIRVVTPAPMTLEELHEIPIDSLRDHFKHDILGLFQALSLDAETYWYLLRHLRSTPIDIRSIRVSGPFLEITDLHNKTCHLWFPSPGDRDIDRPEMDKFLARLPILMHHGFRDSEDAIWYNTEHGCEIGLWDKVLRFMWECFKTDLISWKISEQDLKETDCFKKLRKFNEVYQRITLIESFEIGSPTDNAITLSREDLRICLEETACEVSSFIKAEAPKYTGGLYHRKIRIQGASWLTVDTLLQMEDVEELQAESDVTLTPEDLNKFLLHWMKSKDQIFREMVLAPLAFSFGDMRKKVLKDVPATRDPPRQISNNYRGHQLHPTETRYILRADGRMAAVMNVEESFKVLVFDVELLEDSGDSEGSEGPGDMEE